MFFPGETILLVFSLSLLFGAGDRHAWPLDSLELRSVDALTLSFPAGMNWDIPTENIPIHDLQKNLACFSPILKFYTFCYKYSTKWLFFQPCPCLGSRERTQFPSDLYFSKPI